jgi:hypothetical protein
MSGLARPMEVAGECRQCTAFCDKVIDPGSCMAAGCPYLYAYDDQPSGKRFVGCLHKVFRAEVDVALLESARRSGRPFGGLRVTGAPLRHCATAIVAAFERRGHCVNPEFWAAEGEGASSAFDLRDWC